MMHRPYNRRRTAALVLVALLILPSSAAPQGVGDDLFLLTTSVAPNVVLFFDNSRSMNHIEWHEAFDPDGAPYGCSDFDDATVYEYSSETDETHCGNTRTLWAPESPTLWDGRYLNWYFSDAADAYYSEIQTSIAPTSGCQQSGGAAQFADQYRRTRTEAAKQVLLDVLCISEPKGIRFALAEFRDGTDPNGGFVSVEIGRSNPSHAAELESALKNTDTATETTLGETLFQIYTYFMSRTLADIPLGLDGTTRFPRYQYAKDGDWETNSSKWLDDPVEFECQRSFVVLVSDGIPTRDDFDVETPTDEATGFSTFGDLIGDFTADGEIEEPGDPDETAWYLDDIARYMQVKDFRPDMDGDQTIDTYTIGFATDGTTDAFLEKTADAGNGLFFHVQTGAQLSQALVDALNDIIEKSSSFTGATVPSVRTSDGGDFYTSFFLPLSRTAFWEGHLRAWKLTAAGDVHDKDDACALIDPDANECNSGPFRIEALPYWDAADQVPAPASRKLYTSKLLSGTPSRVAFDAGLEAADLTLQPFANPPPDPTPNSPLYPVKGSGAKNEEGLADEVVAYIRGCEFGTGVTSSDVTGGTACEERDRTLGDIFHSQPAVVRHPGRRGGDVSYKAFKTAYTGRTRVIYTGTNGGFLEGIHSRAWQASDTPPAYDRGTGTELFGFMPWATRQRIKNLPIDSAIGRRHYVDGSPQVADVWRHPTPTTSGKNADGSEWRTVLVGGLRRGGSHYYALDITNPDGIAGPGGPTLPYPGYLWEFPREDDPDSDLASMGETWGQPILTRVRLKVGADDNGGVGYERWVAVVTAGTDPTGDPSNPSYDPNALAGRGIFILDLKTGEVLAEQKFDPVLPASDPRRHMEYAIPSTPAVFDLNRDGFADVIYVGDLGGRLWKWVISPVGEDRVNDGSGLRSQPAWKLSMFFEAPVETVSGTDYFKQFYLPPAGTQAQGKLWLAFGSGERRDLPFEGFASDDENNRFYVMTDTNPLVTPPNPHLPELTEDPADLTDVSGNEGAVSFSTRGYYFKAADGEKFVTNVLIFSYHVIVASFTPDTSSDACAARGHATLYVFDLLSGEGYFRDGNDDPVRGLSIGTGLPNDPRVSVGVGGKGNIVYIEKSGADLESIQEEDIQGQGRYLYWREAP